MASKDKRTVEGKWKLWRQLGQCPKARSLVRDSTILTTIYCDAVDQEFDTNKSDNISETTCPVNCLFSLLPWPMTNPVHNVAACPFLVGPYSAQSSPTLGCRYFLDVWFCPRDIVSFQCMKQKMLSRISEFSYFIFLWKIQIENGSDPFISEKKSYGL